MVLMGDGSPGVCMPTGEDAGRLGDDDHSRAGRGLLAMRPTEKGDEAAATEE